MITKYFTRIFVRFDPFSKQGTFLRYCNYFQETKSKKKTYKGTKCTNNCLIFYFSLFFILYILIFNPFISTTARTPRLFLAAIPPRQRLTGTKIQYEIIDSSTPADRKHPLIRVTYKDKKEMEVDTSNMTFQEVSNFFDGHSRKLRIKEAVESQ